MSTDDPYRAGQVLPELDRSVLVVGLSGRVIGLDRATGTILWAHDLPDGPYGEVALAIRYGMIVASASSFAIAAFAYPSGTKLWANSTTATGRASLVLEADRIVCAKSGYLDCYAHDGTHLWSQPLEGFGMGGVALGFPGNVVQADAAHRH